MVQMRERYRTRWKGYQIKGRVVKRKDWFRGQETKEVAEMRGRLKDKLV